MNPGIADSERIRTILLVEDDESTRSFIQRFLERDGYEVIAVDAAEEGIVEAGETIPDVLISDIHLPGLNGIELASFLLAQDPGLPVILMTGDPDEDLARRALACGPVQYLLKPFEWFEMEAAVGFALRQRQAVEVLAGGMNGASVSAVEDLPIDAATGPEEDGQEDSRSDAADPVFEVGADIESLSGAEQGEPDPVEADSTLILEGSETGTDTVSMADDSDMEAVIETESDPVSADEVLALEWVELEPITDDGPAPVGAPEPEPSPVDGEGDPLVPVVEDPEAWLDEVDRASYAGPGHGDRVARLVLALYDALDEPGSVDAEDLALAARVHEVGRLHLPEGEPIELAVRGAEVLAEAGFPAAVTESVRHMHERWDGTAGPEQLSGSRIPMGAQLLAVADALDHYTSAWIRSDLDPEEAARRAVNLITVQQNQAFSPIVVGAMHQAAAPLREICAQERPPDLTEASPIPAVAAAESVPFALFATE